MDLIVVWIDQTLDVNSTESPIEEARSRAVEYANLFSLFNGFEMIRQKSMARRLIADPDSESDRMVLGYMPEDRNELRRKHMPERGELCREGAYSGGILKRLQTDDGTITLPEDIVQYYERIEELRDDNPNYFAKILQAAKLYNISSDIGRRHLTAQVAYMFASIDALDFGGLKGKDSLEKLKKFVHKYVDDIDVGEDFFDFVYVTVRCNHFHEGETIFDDALHQYGLLSEEAQRRGDQFWDSMGILHHAMMGWIKEEIIG